MDDIQNKTRTVLLQVAKRLRESPLLHDLASEIEQLCGRVEEVCVVAVVGQVKAGKSTLINAFLGKNLAKVGTTETTATINKFCYGDPDPSRPVRCHWRNGKITTEDRAFLDSLQGVDIETLRRADGIRFLEYLLPESFLKQVTLVDTPGIDAVAEEHETRIAEFMNMDGKLRQRHHEETQQIGSEADAVIYLIRTVAKANDQKFLEEFGEVTGGNANAFNAVGVISQIDLTAETLEARHRLSQRIARQLKGNLNTVIPVSAGTHIALNQLAEGDGTAMQRLIETARRMPPDAIEILLGDERLFREHELDDHVPPAAERREFRAEFNWPWSVFTTVIRAASNPNSSKADIAEHLADISGFDQLNKVLKNFFERGNILRCYRIISDSRKAINKIRFVHLPQLRKRNNENKARLDKFLAFIKAAKGNVRVAKELEGFVLSQLSDSASEASIEQLRLELSEELNDLFYELEEYNADFKALQQLEDAVAFFSAADLEELRPLLGLYGISDEKRLSSDKEDAMYVRQRQLAWRQVETETPIGSARRAIANRASTRYGLILDRMSKR